MTYDRSLNFHLNFDQFHSVYQLSCHPFGQTCHKSAWSLNRVDYTLTSPFAFSITSLAIPRGAGA